MQLDKVTFNGTPLKFKAVAKEMLKRWGELAEFGPPIRGVSFDQIDRYEAERNRLKPAVTAGTMPSELIARIKQADDNNVATVVFYFGRTPINCEFEYGQIEAQIAPEDRSFLTVTVEDDHRDKMQERWARLKAELADQGWITLPKTANQRANLPSTSNELPEVKTTIEKKTVLVCSAIISGKVDHFRAAMQRLVIQYKQDTWQSSTGTHLFFGEYRQTQQEAVGVKNQTGPYNNRWSTPIYRKVDVTPPTRGTWIVHANAAYAAIEAYEQPDGQNTRLDFIDGYAPLWHQTVRPQIGAAFVEFADMIMREVQPTGTAQQIDNRRKEDAEAVTLPTITREIRILVAEILYQSHKVGNTIGDYARYEIQLPVKMQHCGRGGEFVWDVSLSDELIGHIRFLPTGNDLWMIDQVYVSNREQAREALDRVGHALVTRLQQQGLLNAKEQAVKSGYEKESLQRQLTEAQGNLRLIEERKTQYVQEVDIPLQLIRDEERWEKRIVELEAALHSK